MPFTLFRRAAGAAALVAAAFGLLPAPAAAAYSDLVFFGDSLSDTGNLNIVTGGALPAGGAYDGGRFSNGPLWTEVMAGLLGQPGDAVAALAGGNNYAFAGARTGASDTPPGILAQAVGIWGPAHAAADPNALYVIVGGGNDMRDARTAFDTDSGDDRAGRQARADQAGGFLIQTLGFLASKGAKNVMIGNLPDLGATPEAVNLGLVAASRDATARFNALMPTLLSTGNSLGLNMSFLDLAGIASLVRLDAGLNGGSVFGITNTTDPCVGFAGNAGNACSSSLFSDDLHPSARVHQIVGLYAAQAALAAMPVPEPETYALLLLGLAVVGTAARRRSAA